MLLLAQRRAIASTIYAGPLCCSLEHCHSVSARGLLHLSHGLRQLAELRLFGSGVSEAAVAQLCRTPRGRRLRIGLHKQCWWLPSEAAALVL